MNMRVIGGEPARFDPDMRGDHLHALVEDPQNTGLSPDPQGAAQILRRDRIIRPLILNVTVAMDGAPSFNETGEKIGGQRQQCQPLGLEQRSDLLPHGAVDARVGHGVFPV